MTGMDPIEDVRATVPEKDVQGGRIYPPSDSAPVATSATQSTPSSPTSTSTAVMTSPGVLSAAFGTESDIAEGATGNVQDNQHDGPTHDTVRVPPIPSMLLPWNKKRPGRGRPRPPPSGPPPCRRPVAEVGDTQSTWAAEDAQGDEMQVGEEEEDNLERDGH